MSSPGKLRMILILFAAAGLSELLLVAMPPEDEPVEAGPDVVMMRELEDLYEPVPFDHQSHAKMAQMWNGCTTCHHRSPKVDPTVHDTPSPSADGKITQDEAIDYPACKSCHPIETDDAQISMPNLKGAYHRQCLNCHQEWMHENACVICHQAKAEVGTAPVSVSPDDIVGRMHPPIPEPDVVTYRTRFTPVAGGNVVFRHKEHTEQFGLKCVHCHFQDNCVHCHSPEHDTAAEKPLRPGMTWDASHGPCMGCHNLDRCRHCHYGDEMTPPKPFDHWATGQGLDEDHAGIACAECHANLQLDCARCHENLGYQVEPSCGDTACHQAEIMVYPARLPGPLAPEREEPAIVDEETTGGLLLSARMR